MPGGAYYNEIDPFACQWLRNLITEGLIPDGFVDERDIREVRADEIKGYHQWHFFAGIGGWAYALQLAGFDTTRPVLTASCPCQPFSAAGKGQGEADERHLWPVLAALIREYQPDICFGEQVSSTAGYEWLDGVRADLEAEGYTFGAADLPACSQGAPHIRSRLFWVANAEPLPTRQHSGRGGSDASCSRIEGSRSGQEATESGGCGSTGGLANSHSERLSLGTQSECDQNEHREPTPRRVDAGRCSGSGRVADSGSPTSQWDAGAVPRAKTGGGEAGQQHGDLPVRSGNGSADGVVGNPSSLRPLARRQHAGRTEESESEYSGTGMHPWGDCRIIPCRDGKSRRVPAESGIFPLAPGVPRDMGLFLAWMERLGYSAKDARGLLRRAGRNRNGRLKGVGNAIVPQVAAIFIRAFLDVEGGES